MYISFVEEGVLNPDYKDFIGGRIEVNDPDKMFAIDEIRFLTRKINEFNEFRDQWDFEDLNEEQLVAFTKIVEDKFQEKI